MNFRSIILPEALKLIQSQEPSILGAVCQLESFVGESTHSLDSLVNELEVIHRNVVMGVQVLISFLFYVYCCCDLLLHC